MPNKKDISVHINGDLMIKLKRALKALDIACKLINDLAEDCPKGRFEIESFEEAQYIEEVNNCEELCVTNALEGSKECWKRYLLDKGGKQ